MQSKAYLGRVMFRMSWGALGQCHGGCKEFSYVGGAEKVLRT